MKKVYVILTRTGTAPAQLVRLATRAEFTHSSIAIMPCRHSLHSFGRRNLNNFLISGYLHEDADKHVYAKYPDSPCAVYEICVSNEGYKRMADELSAFNKRYDKHKYSFIGAVTTQFGIKKKLKYRYTCSQFVATILNASGEIRLPKHPSLIKPMDFASISGSKLVFRGKIKDLSFGHDTIGPKEQ